MKSRCFVVCCAMMAVMCMALPVFAADSSLGPANAERFGFWTLVPPLVAIVLAFATRNVVLSLFLGVFSGSLLLETHDFNLYDGVIDAFLRVSREVLGSLADPWNAGIVLQCLAIGGLIAIVSKMGGARAIAEALAKRARTPRSAQLVTWLMGIFIFFDDYANSLTIGPIMRPVTDRMRVSREKLAFIIDATAAPIAGIALISTWVAYEVGLIKDGFSAIGLEANAYTSFVETIPYRFYNIFILLFVLVCILCMREFGPMLTAERRARGGKVLGDDAKPMVADEATDLEPEAHVTLSVWNAIIPIGTLIVAAFLGFYFNGYHAIAGGDDAALQSLIADSPMSFTAVRECFGASDASVVLFQAALIAGIVGMAMGVCKRIFTVEQAIGTWVQGVKSLNITAVILLLAWSLSGMIKELGTASWLVSVLSDSLPAYLLPSIIFIMGSVISFATGTSYGTMGILMPLAIPLAWAIVPEHDYLILNIGAVLTGAIFGDHCSPISDTTILSSMGAASDHIDHTRTQLPYAVSVAAMAVLFGYLPVGLGLPVLLTLPLGCAAVGAVILLVGRRVDVR